MNVVEPEASTVGPYVIRRSLAYSTAPPQMLVFLNVGGDDNMQELSAERPEGAVFDDADDLVEDVADDTPSQKRVQARTTTRGAWNRERTLNRLRIVPNCA